MNDARAVWYNQSFLSQLRTTLYKKLGDFDELGLIDYRLHMLSKITITPDFWEEIVDVNDYSVSIYDSLEEVKKSLKVHLCTKDEFTTAIVLTYNEDRCIRRCIHSLRDEVDEIIVIDTGSTDETLSIIGQLNEGHIKVLQTTWEEDFSKLRNLGIDESNDGWLFFIDADEWLNSNEKYLLKEFLSLFSTFPLKYQLTLSPLIKDKNEGDIMGVKRIFHKRSEIRFYGKVHEEPRRHGDATLQSQENINLRLPIYHDGYMPDILEEKNKAERNLRLLFKMREIESYNPRWLYFLIREGMDTVSSTYIETLFDQAFNYSNEENYKSQKNYTIPLMRLLLRYRFKQQKYDIVQDVANRLKGYQPKDSDAVFYSTVAYIFKMKTELKTMLDEVISFRENQLDLEYDELHSEELRIDTVIAMLLFECGMYEQANKYFQFLKDEGLLPSIINMYKKALMDVEYFRG
ncbi:glycosyltransferase [Salibacterium halotolerans]|uniref:Glycosyltransferase involved in cell wall bisynthesis n=1 Tax=Salibacterium halotolerans TaxID=1884432 RepID=A0A1I5LA97_9BACI|nr:glycosyltransferase [Salibacterium halotolerans]SFO93641.1 Glycosyltransferase involved in cell wall bisynthesis [Salibacterium halotolerans]